MQSIWRMAADGTREFSGGQEDWAEAARLAGMCAWFLADVDEELVADEERSCYNCRRRRWTSTSFVCLAPFSTGSGSDRPPT